jgi:RNA polymerase sigma-70 factor (ECF subfamily)
VTEARFEWCIERIKQGDKEGLREIYENYIAFIYSVIYEKLQNKENAEDVTSDFFIKLWEKAGVYRPGGGHKGWMATIARNMSVDFLRKHAKEELTDIMQDSEEESESRVSVSSIYDGEKISPVEQEVIENVTLKDALGRLNDSEPEIINLKIMGDLTFKEIANILHMPMGTVTWRYREAIKKLRRCGYEEA